MHDSNNHSPLINLFASSAFTSTALSNRNSNKQKYKKIKSFLKNTNDKNKKQIIELIQIILGPMLSFINALITSS